MLDNESLVNKIPRRNGERSLVLTGPGEGAQHTARPHQATEAQCGQRAGQDPRDAFTGVCRWRVLLVVKKKKTEKPACHARGIRDRGLIPKSERSPGRGHGNPFAYSCLENPMDRGTWRATVPGVARSDTT